MSFLGDLKKAFNSQLKSYVNREGRFVAICFANTVRKKENKVLSKILKDTFLFRDHIKSVRVEYEVPFKSTSKSKLRRYCDVEIDVNSGFRVLVEVKVNDSLSENQLRDYVSYAKKNNARVIVITKHEISPEEDRFMLKNSEFVAWIKFTRLCTYLSYNSSEVNVFKEYIEELITMYKPINIDDLKHYMVRTFLTLKFGGGRRAGKSNLDNSLVSLALLRKNLDIILSSLFLIKGDRKKSFTYDMSTSLDLNLNLKSLRKLPSNQRRVNARFSGYELEDKRNELPDSSLVSFGYKNGGDLYIYAYLNGLKDDFYIEIGFRISISRKKNHAPSPLDFVVYTFINSKKFPNSDQRESIVERININKIAESKVREKLKKTYQEALKGAKKDSVTISKKIERLISLK